MGKVSRYISIFFLVGLLFLLNIGLPIAYNPGKAAQSTSESSCEKNPYANSTEEKTCSSGSISVGEEYVHELRHDLPFQLPQVSITYRHAHEAVYTAYHGEQHCPPPNQQV